MATHTSTLVANDAQIGSPPVSRMETTAELAYVIKIEAGAGGSVAINIPNGSATAADAEVVTGSDADFEGNGFNSLTTITGILIDVVSGSASAEFFGSWAFPLPVQFAWPDGMPDPGTDVLTISTLATGTVVTVTVIGNDAA